MDSELQPPRFRPPSLSLVTVTSLGKKNRLIFNLTERHRSNTFGFTNDADLGHFYDSPSILTPAIVIDHGSDPDFTQRNQNDIENENQNEKQNENQNSRQILSINTTNNSQLVKYLTPPPTRTRALTIDSASVSSISSNISKRANPSTESMERTASFKSRHSNRDYDNISIGGCSIGPTSTDISIDTHYDQNNMNTRLLNFLSVMYALVLVIISAIICVNDLDNEVTDSNNIFTIFTTLIGFVWVVFLHWDIHKYKRWAIEYLRPERDSTENLETKHNSGDFDDISITTAVLFNSLTQKQVPDDTNASIVSPFQSAYRFLHGKHSGNFYLKCGMSVFCFGSIVHMGVQLFTQIYFFTDDNQQCRDISLVLALLIRSIFSFYQLFMAFKYSNILINRYNTIARFALMHLVGTSIAYWFNTIINEAIDDYVHKVESLNKTIDTNASEIVFGESINHQKYCLEKSIINKQSMDALPYLYPFTIEYNIILASVWYMIWTNIGKEHLNAHIHHIRKEISENDFGEQEIQYHSSVSINADCHASNRGLFGGLSTLLITFITIVIFFTTIKQHTYNEIGVSIYSAQIGVLTITCCIVIPLAYRQTRRLDIVRHHNLDNPSTAMDDLLVMVPIPFYLLHYVLSINAASFSEPSFNSVFLIIIYILTIVQVLIQSPFIVDGIRRCSNSKSLRFRKPGRELITFALILNITLWILNTFELKSVETYHGLQEYYGKMTWMIISHTTLPLMLFYRFHSSVCLSDIWKYAYEKDNNISHIN